MELIRLAVVCICDSRAFFFLRIISCCFGIYSWFLVLFVLAFLLLCLEGCVVPGWGGDGGWRVVAKRNLLPCHPPPVEVLRPNPVLRLAWDRIVFVCTLGVL